QCLVIRGLEPSLVRNWSEVETCYATKKVVFKAKQDCVQPVGEVKEDSQQIMCGAPTVQQKN
ncbi:hypothetical protein BgiMline_025357, partial [Biomphalaria glabrata]